MKGLKIGIMGCIVNGPGEMADADYGYVAPDAARYRSIAERNAWRRTYPRPKPLTSCLSSSRATAQPTQPAESRYSSSRIKLVRRLQAHHSGQVSSPS